MDEKKLVLDICNEYAIISKDVKEQQKQVREDIQIILNAILHANKEDLKSCNSYVTNKYPDIVQFTPNNCCLSIVSYNVIEEMSVLQLQITLLVVIGALNNMLSNYKLSRVLEGGTKILIKQAIEGSLKP